MTTTTKNFIRRGIHLLRTQAIVPFSILAVLLFATSFSVQASHYSGGEITYTSTGPNQYLVTLKVYRDCEGISFGTTQLLNYSSANCGVNSSLTLNLQSTEDITPLCSTATSACGGGSGPVGVELLVFQGTLNLPPGCDDWVLSTTSCCRNAAITNISGSSSNEMYFEAHLDNTAGLNNNSPSFSTIPQLFGCVGQTINFQQLAFDSDGDSLVYTLVNALQSSGVSVTYAPGFSGVNPFTVPLTFNSQTGQITFTPNTPQVAVVTVLIEEYRNGVLIGSIMRDIQFIIDDCTNTIPEISGIDGVPGVYDITICEGASVCFDILGSDVDAGQNVTLNYDYTIPGAVFTQGGTSTNPVGTFCWSTNLGDQGTYSFTVFAEDDHCPLVGQNSAVYTVNVIPNPNDPVIASPDVTICAGETVLLTATTTSTSGSTYQWTPVNGLSTPSSASTNATPTSTTSYTVELTYTDGCSSQDVVTVTVANDPTANAFPNNADACGGANFLLSGSTDQTGNNFEWFDPSLSSLGSGTVTGAQSTLTITVPTATGTYPYILVVTNPVSGCQSADTVYLTVGNPPVLPSCVNIYVTPTASAAGAGTQADPTSLLEGLSMAACNNAVIKLAIGTYNIDNPISIGSFSTLEGGFDPGNAWTKTSQPGATTINRTTANPEGAVNAQRLVAMYGNGATGFRLQDLTISTSNANLPGMSTYALHLSACSEYNLVRTQLLPGNAANGATGNPGTNGANGANGNNGLNGDSDQQNDARAGGNGGTGAGAGGGAGGTGAPGAVGCCTGGVNGGAGGAATNFRAGAGGGGGARGGQEDRDGGLGGIGGAYFGGITNTCGGGAGQESGCNSVTGSCNAALSGDNGCAGITGVTGTVGAAGPAGNHLAGFWVPGGLAGTGTDGQGGQGGRGGGGGAGEGGTFCTDGAGASGGGGGGGGQGGTGGFGGRGGGSSIGAYLFNNGANGIINDSRVISGAAGAGGAGGAGGLGGNGGAGGVGGQDDINDYEIGCGGNGGNGGNGRNGGNGGNGAPGVSIPVYLSGGSALALSDINFNLAAQPVITVTNVNCTNTSVFFETTSLPSGVPGPGTGVANWNFDLYTNNATPATGINNPDSTQFTVIDRYTVTQGPYTYEGFHNIAFSQTILPEITSTALEIGVDTFQLCEGDFATFDMNLYADTYVWDFDGAIANPGSVQTVSSQFNTTGFFEISGYGITDCCGPTPIDTVYLFVIPLPVATGSGNAAICQGESTTLSLTGLNPTDSVVWSPTINSVPLSNSSISVSPLVTTTYTATVYSTLTGGGQTVVGCPISIDFVVTVNPLPAVTMSATLVICSNDGSATATTSGGSYNFVWDIGVTDNGVASSTITNLAYGNYAVTITDAITGCSIQDSIDVLPSPTQPIVYIQSLTGTCEGASDGTATANTSGGTAPYTYVWSTAYIGQTISNLPGGLYSVTVTDNNGCSSSVDFDIPEQHSPHLDVFANGPICYGDSVQFELSSHDAAELIYDIGGANQTLIFTDDTMYLTYYNVTSDITMNFTSISLGICVNVLGTSEIVTVIPPPTATIANNGPICFGEDGEFTITGTTDAIVNYTLNGIPNQNITLTGGTATIPITAPPTNSTLVIDSITVGNCAIDTVLSNTLIVNPVSDSTENVVACENTTYTYPDGSTELITGNSSHISTLVNSFGCDSLVTTNVTMNPTYNTTVAVDVCENDAYTYPDGTVATITASTSQTSNLLTSAGCDSVIVTNVTMLPEYSTTVTAAICEGENYTFPDGTIQTNILADVLYTSSFTTVNGCDSTIITDLTVNPLPIVDAGADQQICDGDATTLTASNPSGATIAWNNGISDGIAFTPTTNQWYNVTATSAAGCVSVDSAYITVNPTYNSVVAIDVCENDSYTYPDGTVETITASTSQTSNLLTAASCDSVIVTNVTMLPAYSTTETAAICAGEDYTFPDGTIQTNILADVLYTSSFTTVNGCDSTIITDLTVNPLPIVDAGADQQICDGDATTLTASNPSGATIAWNNGVSDGIAFTPATNQWYNVTATSAAGCVSVDSAYITVNPTYNSVVAIDVCENDSYTYPDGTVATITASTSQTSSLLTSAGCDSVIVTNVTMLPEYSTTVTTAICEGEDYTFPDGTIQTNILADVLYTSSFTTVNGCDSTIITDLTVNPLPIVDAGADQQICDGDATTLTASNPSGATIAWNNGISDGIAFTPTTNQWYNVTATSAAGCVSVDSAYITVNPTYNSVVAIDVCENDSYTYPDGTVETITASTSQTSNLLTSAGCDSVIVTNVTMLPSYSTTVTAAICEGEDYTFPDGTIQTNILADVLYTSSFTTVNGCDSTIITDLTVNPLPIVDAGADQEICDGDLVTLTASNPSGAALSWDNGILDGVAFAPSGTATYTATVTSPEGCVNSDDAIVVVNPSPTASFSADVLDGCAPLTVEFFSSSTGSIVDCVWDFGDGNTFNGCADVQNVYTQAGAQTVSLTVTDINGCTANATYVDYINVYEVPDASFYASDSELDILHTTVDFTNTSSNATNYVWYFGDASTSTQENPSHNYPDDYVGNYQVVLVAINGVCTDTATAILTMNEILIYYVPNTFTPDGDQHNQTFQPIFSSGLDPFDFNMTIYNRWGEKVFETNDVNYGWDATYLGSPVQDGTYIWTMEFKERTSEERHRVNGHVNVLR